MQVVGTAGYAAPEYIQTGHLTVKSDVWSFGIVMLEVLTGRKVMDRNRPKNEQRLVEWAKPYTNDHHKIFQIVDPILNGRYPARPAQKFAQLAYQCLSKFPKHRPKMSDVVEKLKIVQDKTHQWESPSSHSPTSLNVSGEFPKSRDSPRGPAIGSLPSARSGKASKHSPSVRNNADVPRQQIPSLSLECSCQASSPSTTSGAEPKPVDSPVEKPQPVATVAEEPMPVERTPVVSSAEKPEPVATVLEQPKSMDPTPVDSSLEAPELVVSVVEEPKHMVTISEKTEPLDTSAEKPELLDSPAENPKPLDVCLQPVDTPAEKPKLVETVVEEPKVVEDPKLVDELPNAMDAVAEDSGMEEQKRENSSLESVKRRSHWGSDRLSRMSRESGRFTWIPKLSFSTSSTRSTS